MAKRRPGPEQIINKLREAAVLVAKDTKMPVVCRKLESPSRPTTAGARSTVGYGRRGQKS